MTLLTVEIDSELDLAAVEEFLTEKGLKFEKEEENEWGDLPQEEIEAIKAGIEDFENGRVVTHADAMARIRQHFQNDKS